MSKRGFADMDQEQRKLISSKGGKAAHAAGTAHEFTKEQASIAGKKGGLASKEARAKKAATIAPAR